MTETGSSVYDIRPGPYRNRRPKDAATIMVLRRQADGLRVLMGQRSAANAFLPGKVVFPGGSTDRADYHAPFTQSLHPEVMAKLTVNMRGRTSPKRAQALALSAIRETYEETGVLLGSSCANPPAMRNAAWRDFLSHGVLPDLSPLRLIARAITPPRFKRRFDARFFAVFDDAIVSEVAVPDNELIDPAWLTIDEARDHPLPDITRAVLDELEQRLAGDPQLRADEPVPFYHMKNGRFRRDLL
ncbi:MAG TPA: NUDIX hydrolase [Afifellaceae bacterium]|nr:NUDIX hydrolase [Afifellaceae bacterium]